jgi:hypothetical protein
MSALLNGLERIEGDGTDRQRKMDEKLTEIKSRSIEKKVKKREDGTAGLTELLRLA